MNVNDNTYVFLAPISDAELLPVYPNERQREIELTKNEKLKREKYCVWKLLEYAIRECFGKSIRELEFTKTEGGRWNTPFCEFSLSHTDGVVAVAISHSPVGVDVEAVKPIRSEKTVERVLSRDEYNHYKSLSESEREEFFLSVWTKKEAIFKSLHKEAFLPNFDYSSVDALTRTEKHTVSKLSVIVSVAVRHVNSKISQSTEILTKCVDFMNKL